MVEPGAMLQALPRMAPSIAHGIPAFLTPRLRVTA